MFIFIFLIAVLRSSLVVARQRKMEIPESKKLQIKFMRNGDPIQITSKRPITRINADGTTYEVNEKDNMNPYVMNFAKSGKLFTKAERADAAGNITKPEPVLAHKANKHNTNDIDMEIYDPQNEKVYNHTVNGVITNVSTKKETFTDYQTQDKEDHHKIDIDNPSNTNDNIQIDNDTSLNSIDSELLENGKLTPETLRKIKEGLQSAVNEGEENQDIAVNPKILKNLLGFMQKIHEPSILNKSKEPGAFHIDIDAEKAQFKILQNETEIKLSELENSLEKLDKQIKDSKSNKSNQVLIQSLESKKNKIRHQELKQFEEYEKDKSKLLGKIAAEIKNKHKETTDPDKLAALDAEAEEVEEEHINNIRLIKDAMKEDYHDQYDEIDSELKFTENPNEIKALRIKRKLLEEEEEEETERLEKELDEELGNTIEDFNNDIHDLMDKEDPRAKKIEGYKDKITNKRGELDEISNKENEDEYTELDFDINDNESKKSKASPNFSEHSNINDREDMINNFKILDHFSMWFQNLKMTLEFVYRNVPKDPKKIPVSNILNHDAGHAIWNKLKKFREDIKINANKLFINIKEIQDHLDIIKYSFKDVLKFYEQYERYKALRDKKDLADKAKYEVGEIELKHLAEEFGKSLKEMASSIHGIMEGVNFNFKALKKLDEFNEPFSDDREEVHAINTALNLIPDILNNRDDLNENMDHIHIHLQKITNLREAINNKLGRMEKEQGVAGKMLDEKNHLTLNLSVSCLLVLISLTFSW